MSDLDLIPPALAERLPELMRRAIELARMADAPFGCVLANARSGALIVEAGNTSSANSTDHAEMNALRLLTGRSVEPRNVVIVSTAEPCPMCAGAIWWSGLHSIVFGSSIKDLIRHGWRQIDVSCDHLLSMANPRSSILVVGGYLAEETIPLYHRGHDSSQSHVH